MRGVLAHELAHIKNYDILTASVAAMIAGVISSISNIFIFFAPSNSEDGPNPLVSLAMIILAPIAAMLIQFAVSRTREYEADATAAEYTKQPEALASALRRIEQAAHAHPMQVNPAYSSLFIQNPLNAKGIMELFSTHPLTEKRIDRLNQLRV